MFFNNWLFLATIGKQIIIDVTRRIKIINFELQNEKTTLFIKA